MGDVAGRDRAIGRAEAETRQLAGLGHGDRRRVGDAVVLEPEARQPPGLPKTRRTVHLAPESSGIDPGDLHVGHPVRLAPIRQSLRD